ncbi:MAG: EF-P beta-lysylation protein EpmB [Planctomycetota bacterium]
MASILPPNRDSVEASLNLLPGECSDTKSDTVATFPSSQPSQSEDWRLGLQIAIRSSRKLCEFVGVDPQHACPSAESDFPVMVTREYASRIEKGNSLDPLLRQVLAAPGELNQEGLTDPVGELDSIRHKGLLQKYEHRVLLIVSGACAIHCRYCFRRSFPYSDTARGLAEWSEWIDWIKDDSSIHEVILSGGDPLSVADSRLDWLLQELDTIPHLRRIRFHTRLPVVLPSRITEALCSSLNQLSKALFIVLHTNHANEIDAAVSGAIRKLRSSGATLMNQAVLLRGVNDDFESLYNLCAELVDQNVLPYYLHQLDPVQGGLHFQVSDQRAFELIELLRTKLPGYAVPKLVREEPDHPSKTALM